MRYSSPHVAVCVVVSLLISALSWAEEPKAVNAPTEPAKPIATEPAPTPPAEDKPTEKKVAPTPPPTVASDSLIQIKALEQRVNELKEKVFRSKARLNLLKETVLHGTLTGSRATIRHKNDMGGSYRLVKVVYALDGQEIFTKSDDTGALDGQREFEVFSSSVPPGDHTLSVQLIYRGHGYGVFSYLEGYEFDVKSSHTFTVTEGRQLILTVRGFEKGNLTTDLKDRPAIQFETNITKLAPGNESASEVPRPGEQ